MKNQIALSLAGVLLLAGSSQVSASLWYDITFTGADIWTYSADNASQSRTDQAAPRRYATYNNAVTGAPDGTGPRVLQATTYGVDGLPGTGFGAWAPTSGFAFDEINLWGAGGATAWGEKYISVGNSDPGAEGVSSWTVLQSPTGWTSGIVKGNDPWSADSTHAFPVWRSGTGAALSLANMNDPDFVFKVRVEISNPGTAFEPDGRLRVFFGGYRDDNQMAGPDNYEVSGTIIVPEPSTYIAGALMLLPFGASAIRMMRKNRTA